MVKKEKHLLERVTLLGSQTGDRLEVPAGITLAEARERVESSWSWPARRLLFFASDGAWIWDEAQPLFGGSWIVGRAPWPVTVVLRLLSANAKTVSHPVPVCIPAGVLATAKGARVALGRSLGMAPELFEQLRFEAGETTPLEDDENLEVAKLKAMICRFRPAAQRMMLELLRMRVLWTMGKKGQRPPPQEAWLAPISEGGAPCECLRTLQAAVRRVESEAGDLIFNATEDAYRWRVELKKPAQAEWIEMLCTFPAFEPKESGLIRHVQTRIMGSGASSNKMGRGPKNLSLKPRQRKAAVTYTAVVPFDDAKATLEAEEILESYRSFEDTDPGDKDGPPLPPGRLEHDSHLRRMEMFQHQVEKDPMEFLERIGL